MSSHWETSSNSPSPETPGVKVPSDFLLSVTTAPLMLILLGSKVFSSAILEISRSSEAVFQGDRLPVLNFPHQTHSE